MAAPATTGPNHQRKLTRWWAAAVLPLIGAAALSWWFGDLLLQSPDDETDPAGVAALFFFMASVGLLGTALVGLETLFLIRCHGRSSEAHSVGVDGPPGWFVDPWRQAGSRWWDGFNWTGRLK